MRKFIIATILGLRGRLTPRILRERISNERARAALAGRQAGQCFRISVERRRDRYEALGLRLNAARAAYVGAKRTEIERARERVRGIQQRAKLAVDALLLNRSARVERAERLLAAVSYRGVLERGFALVRDRHGHPLRNAAAVSAGARIDIEFSDGRVRALAEGAAEAPAEAPAPPAVKPKRRSGGPGQGSLF